MADKITKKPKKPKKTKKQSECCAYKSSCYLASELNCFGYKIDCILYRQSNGEAMDAARFDYAMNKLIDKTRYKYAAKAHK